MSRFAKPAGPLARQPAPGGGPDATDIACFVFDLDGTLSNTWPVALSAFRSAIQGVAGRDFSDCELIALAGPAEEGILQRIVPNDWEACFGRYIENYGRALPNHEILFPGVFELLKAMKRHGMVLAVNSGKTLAAVEVTLRRASVYDDFALVQGGSAAGDCKAENLCRIVERLGLDRSCVAFVGDSVADVIAARAAGVRAIGAAWAPIADPAELRAAEAEEVFEEVAAFRGWLRLPP